MKMTRWIKYRYTYNISWYLLFLFHKVCFKSLIEFLFYQNHINTINTIAFPCAAHEEFGEIARHDVMISEISWPYRLYQKDQIKYVLPSVNLPSSHTHLYITTILLPEVSVSTSGIFESSKTWCTLFFFFFDNPLTQTKAIFRLTGALWRAAAWLSGPLYKTSMMPKHGAPSTAQDGTNMSGWCRSEVMLLHTWRRADIRTMMSHL